MPLALLSASFQSLPPLPTSKFGPSGADSQAGGFVYILGPWGSLLWTVLWGWEFLLPLQPPWVFSVRGFEALFPYTGTLVAVCLAPHFFLPIYPNANVGPPAPPAATSLSPPAATLLQVLSAGCPTLSLIPVWMNVSSLSPWLLYFHTVRFSVCSGCLLFFNLLLSFFWLCEEAQCIYLCLHLDRKSNLKNC